MSQDLCQVSVIHREQVEQAQKNMPANHIMAEAAEVFSLLGDPTRLRILQALSTTELCVCDLAALLDASSSAVSHQLRLLRGKRIVRFRKDGKIAYYSLNDNYVVGLLRDMFGHIGSE